ncbi:MAG: PQQ-dependent sugar dehydrogenase, partial [Gemmatimonadota bacterium]|nr:PQQ-dependent sugar dehydrogenase [Gemmatimonadota bacterium]
MILPGATMRQHTTPLFLLAAAFACGAGPGAGAQGDAPASPQPGYTEGVVRTETVASGLEHPWGLAFLPDGRILVTERPGRLRIVGTDGSLSAPLTGVPAVHAVGQGGLLDVGVDPNFAENRLVYLTYAEEGEGGAGTAAARGTLGATGLENVTVIYRQRPKVEGGGHYGSRVVFAPDGKLFVTQGERMNYRDRAQDLMQGLGKIVRLERDGTVPHDNPFAGRTDALPEIWSYGHRNVQGGAI